MQPLAAPRYPSYSRQQSAAPAASAQLWSIAGPSSRHPAGYPQNRTQNASTGSTTSTLSQNPQPFDRAHYNAYETTQTRSIYAQYAPELGLRDETRRDAYGPALERPVQRRIHLAQVSYHDVSERNSVPYTNLPDSSPYFYAPE